MTSMHEPPSWRETELNLSRHERCHSYARAEKDLIVKQALRAWEGFRHPDATLALDGGTCLTVYRRLLNRFSEYIDMRVILTDELQHGPAEWRIAAFHEISRAFKEHVNEALPFLEKSEDLSRRPVHGRIETHVLLYQGRMPHKRVLPGLKLELVPKPNRLPLARVRGLTGGTVQVVDPMEICMGKWEAVCGRLPGRARTYRELIRHPWDLGAMSEQLAAGARIQSPADSGDTGERLSDATLSKAEFRAGPPRANLKNADFRVAPRITPRPSHTREGRSAHPVANRRCLDSGRAGRRSSATRLSRQPPAQIRPPPAQPSGQRCRAQRRANGIEPVPRQAVQLVGRQDRLPGQPRGRGVQRPTGRDRKSHRPPATPDSGGDRTH